MRNSAIILALALFASQAFAQEHYKVAADGKYTDLQTWQVNGQMPAELPDSLDTCTDDSFNNQVGGSFVCGDLTVKGDLEIGPDDQLFIHGDFNWDSVENMRTIGELVFLGPGEATWTTEWPPVALIVIVHKPNGRLNLAKKTLHNKPVAELDWIHVESGELYLDEHDLYAYTATKGADAIITNAQTQNGGEIRFDYEPTPDVIDAIFGKIAFSASHSNKAQAKFNPTNVIPSAQTEDLNLYPGQWIIHSPVTGQWFFDVDTGDSIRVYDYYGDTTPLQPVPQKREPDGSVSVELQANFIYALQYEIVQPNVATDDPELPEEFTLLPAYPNPFNPSTQFELQIERSQFITVEAFDVLGRRVAVLHDGVLPIGSHTIKFDTDGLPSGTYIVRARGEGKWKTRMATLMK